MRRRIRSFLQRFFRAGLKWLNPPPDLTAQNRYLQRRLDEEAAARMAVDHVANSDAMERISELLEASQMAGTGPWRIPEMVAGRTADVARATLKAIANPAETHALRESFMSLCESNPILAQGAYGDIELALQNVEWRREINLSWLEFSRWGIQQIILISRLNYIKNPWIQCGINVAARYVFGRGYEVSSPDEDANEVLKDFMEANKSTLGQIALTELERRKYYDGNLFFAFFSDTAATGNVTVRTIDATEIQDIVTSPDDTDQPWYYHRQWTNRIFDPVNGTTRIDSAEAWYPALGYDPSAKPKEIGGKPVMWDTPVLHRKCGGVAKWHFGCPLVYAALDWAKASKRFLEACATVKASLAQISMTLTTKGGQAAIEGAKQQLGTTVGPTTALWDENPTAVNASIFASGPGTTLQAFKTSGAGGDPEEVRRFVLCVAMVFGLPETFFGDVKTGNLATAQSLDRPTELNFLEKQEAWREDLCTIAKHVLSVSMGAAGGKLREAMEKRKVRDLKVVSISEARRVSKAGETVRYEAAKPSDDKLEVMVTFPSVREGDIPAMVTALSEAMTLGNKGGQIVGIDEKAGIRKMYEIVGIDKGDELIEEQYPKSGKNKYDPNRTIEDAAALAQPISTRPAYAQGGPEAPGGHPQPVQQAPAPGAPPAKAQEALRRLIEAAKRMGGRAA